jgi:hypothetical protein
MAKEMTMIQTEGFNDSVTIVQREEFKQKDSMTMNRNDSKGSDSMTQG